MPTPGRCIAQALHRSRIPGATRSANWRFDRGAYNGRAQRRRHHPGTRRRRDRAGAARSDRDWGSRVSDTIFVSGLLIHAHHGVMAHEGKVGQRFVIDLELTTDLATASRSEKPAATVDYGKIVNPPTEVFPRRSYRLIEAAGGAVADAILAKFAN